MREVFSVVRFLAERIDLVSALRITHPDQDPERPDLAAAAFSIENKMADSKWSAFDICEAWAQKRGYVTARSKRPDQNRAANHILRMCLEGKIVANLYPPNYCGNQSQWEKDTKVKELLKLLGLENEENVIIDEDIPTDTDDDSSSSNDDDDEKSEGENAVLSNKFSLLQSCD